MFYKKGKRLKKAFALSRLYKNPAWRIHMQRTAGGEIEKSNFRRTCPPALRHFSASS